MQTSKNLIDAAKLLSPYVEMSDRHALTSALLEGGSDTLSFSGENSTVESTISNVAMKLHEIVDGGINMNEFMKEIKGILSIDPPSQRSQIAKKIREFIRITIPGLSGEVGKYSQLIEAESTTPSADDVCYMNDISNYRITPLPSGFTGMTLKGGGISDCEKLYAVEFLNPRLGMPGRDTPAISIFTSLISPIEMSRCVPYVNISIKTSGSAPQGGNKPTYSGLSLMSFLNGKGETSPGRGLDNFLSFSDGLQIPAGMEIFTSPQTLIPTRDNNSLRQSRSRVGPNAANVPAVLDRFRPLMSLKSLSFSVVPTKGIMSYKSGKMEVVLHDRSRLPEVAGFVKPGLYAGTDIDIEYGWSHPAGKYNNNVSRNPVGSFLNSLRVREKYTVVNSSYNFEDSGQVNISLSIAMKGNSDIVSTDIAACGESTAARQIHEILQQISETISSSQASDRERFSKIFGDVILTAVGSESSALSVDEEKLEVIKEKLAAAKVSKNPVDKTLANSLESLFNSTDSPLEKFKSTAKGAISQELTNLSSGIEIFPFADQQILNNSNTIKLFESFDGISTQEIKDPISLGRVLLSFVGKPLAKNPGYKEVHFLFHAFNDKCSFMRDLSIAKFPIPIEELKKELENLLTKNTRVSMTQFILMLNQRFVGNMASSAYGFNFLYTTDDDGNPKRKKPSEDSTKKQKDEFQARQYNMQDRVIEKAGISDGTFKLPKLAVIPECVPDKDDPSKSILRMHVVDEQCSSFSAIADLIRASNDIDITMFGFTNKSEHPLLTIAPELNGAETEKNRQAIVAKLKAEGVIRQAVKSVPSDGSQLSSKEPATELEIDPGALLEHKDINTTKRFISRAIPTITYGRSTGTIKNIGLQSISDPALATVNLLRQSKTDGTSPELMMQRGLPLQVAPTECSIEMLGCPLLSYMQTFFIDFGTGTTADNTYSVTGIEHKIEPGSFTTSVKLTFTDSFAKYTSQIKKIKTTSALLRSTQGNDAAPEPDATAHQTGKAQSVSEVSRQQLSKQTTTSSAVSQQNAPSQAPSVSSTATQQQVVSQQSAPVSSAETSQNASTPTQQAQKPAQPASSQSSKTDGSSDLINKLNNKPQNFFGTVGITDSDINAIISKMFPDKGSPIPVEVATIIDENCKIKSFACAKSGEMATNALVYEQVTKASNLEGRYFVIYFVLNSSTKGNMTVTVINPSLGKPKPATSKDCESINKIGPSFSDGCITTNFDYFQEKVKQKQSQKSPA